MSTKKSTEEIGLKYGSGPQETAQTAYETGSLGATVRYNDDKEIKAGTKLALQDTDGNTFGKATVVHCETLLAMCAFSPIKAHNAAYGMSTMSELVLTLNRYYADTISIETPVKVIIYEPHEISA